MFAIIYAAYSLIIKTGSTLIVNCKNSLARQRAINDNNFAYWDTNGAYRLTSNNKQIRYVNLKNGDRTIQTLDGSVIRNITKEKRDSDIDAKNRELEYQTSPVRLVGRFYDVCPDKHKKGKWFYIRDKIAVYSDNKGNLYFREPTFNSNINTYSYISVEEGRYTFLNNPTEDEKKWLSEKNKALDMGIRTRIHLSNFVESL